MPVLPLGRLFWKFLIFFFLAQATAVLGFGLAIWATTHASLEQRAFAPPPPPGAFEPGQPPRPGFVPGPFPQGLPPPRAMGGPENGFAAGEPPAPGGPRPPILHLFAGAVVSLIFAALLAAYVARPIRRLRQALREAADGHLTSGLAEAMGDRRDELADLGRDFDHMAQHLDQLMQGQRHLLHDVSHELRSPLARLTAIIGIARQQPEKLDECLLRLEHESARMDRLLSELLTLSRLEAGMAECHNEDVDVDEVLAAVVADAAPQAEQAGCRVELSIPAESVGTRVHGDAEMLHRVFDNLLRNALTYAADGGWVGIGLTCADGEVCVRVEDRGPGVRGSDLPRLFEPFFRGPQGGGKSGHGLGLAIARQIVENHRGRITLGNRAYALGGGFCASVYLPLMTTTLPG